MFSHAFRTFWSVAALSLLVYVTVAGQNVPNEPAVKLPERVGDFSAAHTVVLHEQWLENASYPSSITPYVSKDGHHVFVVLSPMVSDSAAYAELTQSRKLAKDVGKEPDNAEVGTAGFSHSGPSDTFLIFFKGRACVTVRDGNGSLDLQRLTSFAKGLSDSLDKGTGEIPVLVKHLPDWQNRQGQVLYAVNKEALKNVFSNQSVLDVVSFEGGAEAAVADYGGEKLVVVEFNTASLATDNDQRIKAKLQELGTQGQPAPTAYRRVGNYVVFVFDAPNEQAANQLIDQVKYEQVVQWLGENPFSYEKATREFTETTLAVFVSVVETSGAAVLTCLAVGGFFGALLFRFRRAQQRSRDAYADSDAMLRLNLDELTPESDPERLLGRGN